MTKQTKIILAAVAAVFLIALALSVSILRKTPENRIEIVQNGSVLYTFDLNTAENQTIRIPAAAGGYNTVVIENGTVRVDTADCPDQTCVKMGTLKSEHLPLVCLPHKLIVRFAEDGASRRQNASRSSGCSLQSR